MRILQAKKSVESYKGHVTRSIKTTKTTLQAFKQRQTRQLPHLMEKYMSEMDNRIGFVETGYTQIIEIGGEDDKVAEHRALGNELERRDAMRLQIVEAL